MQAEGVSVGEDLVASGELGGGHVPRMEVVHIKNAARLRQLIERQWMAWPCERIARLGRAGTAASNPRTGPRCTRRGPATRGTGGCWVWQERLWPEIGAALPLSRPRPGKWDELDEPLVWLLQETP
jgi:hypothetical protein